MKNGWIIFGILFLSLSLSAQEFQMRHYGVNEGLPGSQVYDIQQSPTGDIWIATDLGACQYNGYLFKTYTAEDGLADNSIVKLAIQDSGVVWMLGFNRKLSWVGDSARAYQGNESLLEKLGTDQITSLGFNASNKLLLGVQSGSRREGYFVLADQEGNWKPTPAAPGISWDSESGVFGGSLKDSLFEPLQKSPTIALPSSGREMIRKVEFDSTRKCWYILTRHELWQLGINGDLRTLDLKSRTTGALIQDEFGNLWIGSYHGLLVTHPDRWGKLIEFCLSMLFRPFARISEKASGSGPIRMGFIT
ncbi:hypothetical protein KFE98_05160 [bacterium SCSIO 12741]|nr:hypothetical protein KFE98_05160 [bacterium SCSIO 12741]